ncbi:MAG: DUF5320 domain-containing protein [Bacteroidales bacterium]|nr:DUF5320 domain-containing protein [Bacteroidales bacterium]
MPRGDKTGPEGMGPMTGRGAGFCAGFDEPGYMNQGGNKRGGFGRGSGRGFGRGFGRSYGRGFGYHGIANYPDVSQKTILENDIKILKDQLKSLEKRLSETKEND